MLKVAGVHTFYGNIEALRGIDLDVAEGEIVTLIGANGAGKTTLLMTICGNPRAARGTIKFEGADITRDATFKIVRLGIAQAPEGRRIFPGMTVMENLQMGATISDPEYFETDVARVYDLFPILPDTLRAAREVPRDIENDRDQNRHQQSARPEAAPETPAADQRERQHHQCEWTHTCPRGFECIDKPERRLKGIGQQPKQTNGDRRLDIEIS